MTCDEIKMYMENGKLPPLNEATQEASDHIRKVQDSFVDKVREAHACAIREGIKVNSILINKNMVKVPATWIKTPFGHTVELTPMLCGLNVFLTEDELPETYSFALIQAPEHNTRLGQFESIGMEPEELRKAAELYKFMKEHM